MNKSIFWAAIFLVAVLAGGATGALITNYAIKASPELTDKVLLIDPNDPTNTKSATLSSLGELLVDWASPGAIGSITPAAGTFTTITADGFDFGDPSTGETGEIGLPEDPANGTNTVTIKAPASMASDLIYTLPSVYPAASGFALVADTSGIMSFAQVLTPSNIGVTVQAYDADLADLADGSLTGSKVDLSALSGTIYSTGNTYTRVPVIAKTATATLAAQECSSTLITNTGATTAIVLTLPDAVAGMRITVVVAAAYDIDINPYGTEQILNLTDVAGDAISSDAVAGSYITLVAVSATQWLMVGGSGTWTDVN